MDNKPLPARPSLAQYRKQAKDLAKRFREAQASLANGSERMGVQRLPGTALARVREQHPRFAKERTPESVKALLEAGASTEGIAWPCGYAEADPLLEKFGAKGLVT